MGNAAISISASGKNISERPIQAVRSTITTKNEITIDKIIAAYVDKEQVTPRLETKRVGEGFETTFVFDAIEAIEHDQSFHFSYTVKVDEEYADAFNGAGDETLHNFHLRTDEFRLVILAPEGFNFLQHPRTTVHDFYNCIRILEEEDRIYKSKDNRPRLDQSRRRVTWTVKNPRISYRYAMYFRLSSETSNQQPVPSIA